jgi:hypothetical protein
MNPTVHPIRVSLLALAGGCFVMLAALAGCGESPAPAAPQLSPPTTTVSGTDFAAKSVPDTAPAPKPQGIRTVTFDAVKLDMKKGEPFDPKYLTAGVKQLDGARIRVRGYIFPPPQQTGLARFVLVRDNQQCCFGPGAALFDSMIVDMPKGETIDYTLAPIMVEGTFSIKPIRFPDGKYVAIYHLAAEKAQ